MKVDFMLSDDSWKVEYFLPIDTILAISSHSSYSGLLMDLWSIRSG